MPAKYVKKSIETDVLDTLVCNCCTKTTDVQEDPLEAQEYLSLDIVGGYTSVFGDGKKYDLTLCQSCVKRLIGHHLFDHSTGKYYNEQ